MNTTTTETSTAALLQRAAAELAARDADHAREANAVGFNQSDTWYGHSIAALPVEEWTPEIEAHAYRVLRKYRNQLDAYGIDFDAIPVPALPQDERTKDAARATVYEKMGERRRKREREEAGPPRIIETPQGWRVSFPYDPAMVEAIKEIPGRKWDGDAKVWTIPVTSAIELAGWGRRYGAEGLDTITADEEAIEWAASRPKRRIELDGERVRIIFPYDPDLVADVKRVEGRRFDGDAKIWTAPLSSADAIRAFAREHGFTADPVTHEALGAAAEATVSRREASAALDADVEIDGFGAELLPFQRAGLAYAVETKRLLIGDEMGLGKTLQALATAHAADAFPVLVICPNLAGLGPRKWAGETLRALPGRSVSLLNGQSGRSVSVLVPAGPDSPARRAEVPVNDFDADVLIVNYDKLPRWVERDTEARGKHARKVKAGTPLAEVMKRSPRTLIFDESHYAKNHTAARTQALVAIAKGCEYRIGLSGTSAVNRPSELLAQLTILDRLNDLGGFRHFTRRYCGATDTRFGLDLSGATNLPELNQRLREVCYVRRLKADVLPELPAKRRSTAEVDLADPEAYRRAEADFLSWIGEQAAADADFLAEIADLDPEEQADATASRNASAQAKALRAEALVRINALRQLAAQEKLPALIEWATDFLDQGEKLVLFAHHRAIQEALYEALADYNPARIVGGAEGRNNPAEVERFQTDESCRVVVASLSAGREGIELTAASNVAFAELGWTPTAHDQAEDRCYGRLNDPHGLNSYFLLGAGTIDADIAELIDAKREVVDQILDGRTGSTGASILGSLLARLAARNEAA